MVSVALGRDRSEATPLLAGPVALRVSGGKPLRLRGTLLVEGQSRAADSALWHAVSVWRLEGQDVAVALRTHRQAAPEADLHRAELFPTLAEALEWLEGFDPVADLAVDFDASDRRLSAVEIALRAAALRGRADQVTRQWRALLGEVLFLLDAEEAAAA
ncbi:hypothetical protein [Falsiroseomonas selenitidurans]|uniref:Uncharacterized protein n=1 Tax=Falsiroseomonas selenitidurans TaxID=2716335 RepID=A0ABX1EFI3_9PROT|nr:hypothetical protein [Falsiroseomonas selenitidurans]NKC34478.1 hypothetical protein [Falsiroseomonas selenitidurans]